MHDENKRIQNQSPVLNHESQSRQDQQAAANLEDSCITWGIALGMLLGLLFGVALTVFMIMGSPAMTVMGIACVCLLLPLCGAGFGSVIGAGIGLYSCSNHHRWCSAHEGLWWCDKVSL